MIIETARLLIRKMVVEDANDMLRLHSNPEVQKFTGEDIIMTLEGIHDKIKEKQDE